MIQKLIHLFVRPRHYWRHVGFDELSELYSSMMFRSLAMSIVAIFIPVYLYQLGHEVWEILFFYAVVFMSQTFFTGVAALSIARFGPKHTILLSYFVQMLGLTALTQLKTHPNIPIELIAIAMGAQLALFFTAFNVDFSKVKHNVHGGKEFGWVYIMQKMGSVLGPVVGGAVAVLFGSQYIFFAALILFAVGSIPLLLTAEPTRLGQKLDFKHLSFKSIKPDIISFGAFAVENTISVVIWPLFIGVIVFKENPYVQIGGVASLSMIAALVMARMIGTLADNKKGRSLMRFNAVFNAIVHLWRPFASGFSSVLAVGVVNESITVGYKLPYMKGMFDAADRHPGFRIVYISIMEGFGAFCSMIFYLIAGMLAAVYGTSQMLFIILFGIGAISSLLITLERYKALD